MAGKSKKKIVRVAKLQFAAGQAKPGPALAGLGINMPEFTRAFNDKTRELNGEPTPVRITIYGDKTFDFEIKTAPTSFKLLQAAKVKLGAKNARTETVATISLAEAKKIAEYKMKDMNTTNVDAALQQVAGTARNMGIKIEGVAGRPEELTIATSKKKGKK